MKFKKIYTVKIVKYNFDEPILSFKKKFENQPTELDLENTVKECNEKYPRLIAYGTTIHVEEHFIQLKWSNSTTFKNIKKTNQE